MAPLTSETDSQEIFAKDLVDYIVSKCAGTHAADGVITEAPYRNFIIGSLAAKQSNKTHKKSADSGKASVRAQMIRVSFLAETRSIKPDSNIEIEATGNVYYEIRQDQRANASPDSGLETDKEFISSEEDRERKRRWKRESYTYLWTTTLSKQLAVEPIDFLDVTAKANADPVIVKRVSDDAWQAELSVQRSSFDSERTLISVSYRNSSIERPGFDSTLFDCRFSARLHGIDVAEFEDRYTYEGYDQRYFYDFRPVNCQAFWQEHGKIFYTGHYGVFRQDDVRPADRIESADLRFCNLQSERGTRETLPLLTDKLSSYLDIYEHNLPTNQKEGFQEREGQKQKTWGERAALIDNFRRLLRYVEDGVALINSRADVLNAFLKTNETFSSYYAKKELPDAGWRVFQLIFFLASIRSIVERKELDTASILHVDTGGGKSEAYYALIVFTAFYDRGSGKSEGVSSLVKFPLRMVSIDQLGRMSGIIMQAEVVRRKYGDLFPGERFSIGYFVGGQSIDFPNSYKQAKSKYAPDENSTNPIRSIILPDCPICSINECGSLFFVDDAKHQRLLHRCDKCGEEFHIYISDREIFRWRPTVVVSTVDKWASSSQQRRVRNLLGGNGSYCPDGHGFIPSGDFCENKTDEAFKCENVGLNQQTSRGPTLSVQDEMHLLREGFGTISSHFEGLIESFVEDTSGSCLKHLAMSATLHRTSEQIRELYWKNSFIIPGRCPEGVGSENDVFFDKFEAPKRIIYGLKPNIRDNHYASLRTVRHFAEFIIDAQKRFNRDPKSFCDQYNLLETEQAQRLIKQFLIPLSYHLTKLDATDMETYRDAVVTDKLLREWNTSIRSHVLTGDSTLEELKSVMNEVKSFVSNYDQDSLGKGTAALMSLHATSVVSHGVDLEELNFMIFQGLPYSTSEYIQALSRIGRKQLGIVLVWFYPTRVRDDSYYRNFQRFHETLDHQVRPVPINRAARLGLQQTINSMFCAGVINYLSNKKGYPIYTKGAVLNLTPTDLDDLAKFIKNVYRRPIIDLDIGHEINARMDYIRGSHHPAREIFPKVLADSPNYFYRNQLGMRGIQQQLVLDLNTAGKRILGVGPDND